MKHLGDITKIRGCVIAPVDVAVGGSPCQDLSIAGPRKGLAGERSGLYMEQIRVVKELRYADMLRGRTGELIRPRFMVWENVHGAFSSNKGEDFRVVLEEAARVVCPGAAIPGPPGGKWRNAGCVLGDGWSMAWRVLDAQFWGVPQRRRRIALVVDFGGHAASEILFVRKGVSGDTQTGGEAGKAAAGGTAGGAGGAVTLRIRGGCEGGGKGALIQEEQSGTLGCHNDQTLFCPEVAQRLKAKGNLSFREDSDTLICAAFIGGQGAKAGSIGWAEELAPTLKAAECGSNRAPCVLAIAENQQQELRLTDKASSLTTGGGKPGQGYPCVLDARGNGDGKVVPTLTGDHQRAVSDYTALCFAKQRFGEYREGVGTMTSHNGTRHTGETLVVAGLDCRNGTENAELSATLQAKDSGGQSLNCTHPVRVGKLVRRLTPLECERLQGYPDGWTEVGLYIEVLKERERKKMVQYPTAWEKGMRRLGLTADELCEYRVKQGCDSARYKALGNSIALPQWRWVMMRISALYERPATLGSFFDGIGGFPLIWERLNGPGSCLWASEIEAFPMAVTRYHFGEG